MNYKRFITYCCALGIALCTPPLCAQKQTRGKASYYSDKLHGRRMSNGEIYHRDSMTCAHLHYPLGTLLRVRNPLNDKEVFVRVTDRGPYSRRFIIDLSKAAARELGFIQSGICQVEITPVHPNKIPFRPDDRKEVPELHLEYQDIVMFPTPVWKTAEALQNKAPQKTPIKQMPTGKK